jgi:hypothetical protein
MALRTCAVAVLALAASPAVAGAATVSVTEENVGTYPPHKRSALTFEAASAENNIATIAPAGEEAGNVRYEVRDLHVPLSAGPGCSGGGGPDTPVICLMPRSRPAVCETFGCTDLGNDVVFRFTLGDGNDELRAALLPADDGGGGSISLTADAGSGDDQLYPGPTNDTLEPGPGADTVRSNRGDDFVDASDSPDGPDFYDLRDGSDTISYLGAAQPVTVHVDDLANDGGVSEGDTVVDAEEIIGTRGPDTIWGGDASEALRGAGGGDVLIGNGGDDVLEGTPLGSGLSPPLEDDTLRGGKGSDTVLGSLGDDWALGGPGNDTMHMGEGDDLGDGGNGADLVDGGEDADRLVGRAGRDRLDAGIRLGGGQDGAADKVHCGPSHRDHAVNIGLHDRVEACERVRSGKDQPGSKTASSPE